jgi:hypothetical protein
MFVAQDWKATKRPAALMTGTSLTAFPCPPVDGTEASVVLGVQPAGAPKHVSRTYTSPAPLAPPVTILLAPDAKAANPSPELTQGEPPLAAAPSVATEISAVVAVQPAGAPLHVSRKNTQLLSPPQTDVPGRMFVACESNATKRPSPLTEESRLCPFVGDPS